MFFFNNEIMSINEKWEERVDLLQGLLNEITRELSIIFADCFTDTIVTRVLTSIYVNRERQIKDLLTDKEVPVDKHMIKLRGRRYIRLPSRTG